MISANQKAAMQAGAQASARVLAPLHAEAASALRLASGLAEDAILNAVTQKEADAFDRMAARFRDLANQLEGANP